MSVLKTIFEVLKALPGLIAVAREAWKAIKEFKKEMDEKERAKELKEAIKDAREKKDTTKLDKFFRGDE